ncbi:hypothetical protein J2Z66_005167 [Paenibacillus eucommiae]|uniref:Uncharacterized protein n=1 Tax=Paenibacillus eucommiae TaxID=1355755 RepID=A0ABS4J146_9BACL|nr:hypothetical protein [Paenibacillus eucommiae]
MKTLNMYRGISRGSVNFEEVFIHELQERKGRSSP